jgi:hypothetical protein
MVSIVRFLVLVLIIALLIAGIAAWASGRLNSGETGVRSAARDRQVVEWILDPASHPEWVIEAGIRCEQAPFQMPTRGYIGFLWDDSFRPGHRHQGIDIFGGGQPGDTPVYAAADGYLTREADWKSSLIIRIPDDPLQPGRQIWTYYTHLANPTGTSLIAANYPPGTREVFVQAGTLLGYQGNFSGTPGAPVGVHLHFSIVQDDGQGGYKNELSIANTLDPSPYLGLNLNAHTNASEIPLCPAEAYGDQP